MSVTSYVMHAAFIDAPLQMTFAICLQVPNHLRFKRYSDIWTNFIPQMIFMQSIFGYLVLCILYKWSVDWTKSSTAPTPLLTMLINMFLSPGTIEQDQQLYAGQGVIQMVLLLLAAICVPWLLVAKPYLQYKEMTKIQGQGYIHVSEGPGRHSTDEAAEAEEEGNGRAMAEDADEEHVSTLILHK
jgi:V-type H+-transporting ATPase subunit a